MSKESEKAKIAEYKRRLAESDAEDAETAKLFDPHELVREAEIVHEKVHPKLGVVRYGILSTDELFRLDKIKDNKERGKTLLWMMLRKGYPGLTKEDVGKFPGVKSGELLRFLLEDFDFLPGQTGNSSVGGSEKAAKRRKRG